MVETTNLISYHGLYENAANTTVADSHGSNTGTASTNTNNLFTTDAIFNKGFDFNGTSENVSISNTNYNNLGTGFSAAFWHDTADMGAAFNIFLGLEGNVGDRAIQLRHGSTGVWGLLLGSSGDWFSTSEFTTNVAINTRTHIGVSFDGTNKKLYINGILVETLAASGSLGSSGNPFSIGSNSLGTANFIDGIMSDVAIFNSDIGLSGFQDLYNSGNGLPYPFTTTLQKTSTGNAQIAIPTQKTETGNSRIEVADNQITKTGQARIQINDTEEVYDGIARIEKSFTKTETGNARLEILDNEKTSDGNASLKLRKQKTSSGTARIEIQDNQITKTGAAYISESRIIKYTGTARLEIINTEITKTGDTRLEIQQSKDATGNARIEVQGNQKTSTGNASIKFLPQQITYTGNASLGLIDDFKPVIKAINLTKPTFRSAETFN